MSRCFVNEAAHTRYTSILGGTERARDLPALMQEAETLLSRCPFCGGSAEIMGEMTYLRPGVRVRCRRCGSGTPTVFEGLSFALRPVLAKETLTLEQAVERCVQLWEQREGGAAV